MATTRKTSVPAAKAATPSKPSVHTHADLHMRTFAGMGPTVRNPWRDSIL